MVKGKKAGKPARKGQQAKSSSSQAAKPTPRGGRTSRPRRPRGPRSQALPGMEQVRIPALDRVCETVAEIRTGMARFRADEKSALQRGLALMKEHGVTARTHAGVELARVPGEEHLRVRLTKADEVSAPTDTARDPDLLEEYAPAVQ